MKPNPHLQALAPIIGDWRTTGTHPMMPGKVLHGTASASWIEGGAFLRIHAKVDDPQFPEGISLFGTDDARPGAGTMIYFDSRGVSREYAWTLAGDIWTWSREDAKLAQRMTMTIAPDRLEQRGEMAQDGGAWGPDLSLVYTR